MDKEYRYVLAYGVAIALFIVLLKYRAGYAFIYYVFSLAILFLLVTNAKFIKDSLAPITIQPKGYELNV